MSECVQNFNLLTLLLENANLFFNRFCPLVVEGTHPGCIVIAHSIDCINSTGDLDRVAFAGVQIGSKQTAAVVVGIHIRCQDTFFTDVKSSDAIITESISAKSRLMDHG